MLAEIFADATFWTLVSLLVFIGIAIALKVPAMVTSMLDKRAEGISSELAQARSLREEAERLLADYRRRAGEAEAEAASIISQARHEAEALAVEAKQRIADFVERRTRTAEQKISQAESQALQEVKAMSAEIAISAATRILTARIKGVEAEKMLDRSIAEVKSRLN